MKQTTIRFRFVGNVVLLAVLLMMGAVPAASAQQASLLVRVVADEDCDGTLSGFESPLANWNVFVDENGNGERDDQEPTQVSGGDGYAFLSVNPGTFLVGVERPDDWVPTLPASGFHTVTLEANEHADLPDLGNIRGGSVIGMKFEDIDGDGTFEPLDGEIGLEGWEISMTGTSCAGAAMAYTTTTNEDGIYTFDNVTPGDDYTLFETQQANWNQSFPLGDGLHHADVSSAATVLGNDFGNQRNVPTGVIYGFKFRDLSRDGHYQESEPRLPGWTIYLDLNQNALLDGEEPQTITLEDDSATPEDETGMFRFEDLPSDNYLVREVQQDGWQRTGGPPTPFFLIPDVEVQVLIGNVELAAPLDFGDAPDPGYATLLANDGPRHTIVPGVFLGTGVDAEADGQPHSRALGDDSNGADDEEGVIFNSPLMRASPARITVTASVAGFLDAWADYNRSGVFDESENLFGESMALTAGANLLTFAVPDVAITERLFVRFRFSTTGGLGPTGLAGDGEVEDYALGAILGFKFKDDNKSSTRDNTSLADSTRPERLLPDWTFFLLSNHLDVTPITFTDSLGAFRFTGLPPGEYFLDEELQEGWQRVVINTDSLSIDPGTIFRDLPIGNHCPFITLSGLKWRDDDGNGERGDEPGWDWTIILDGTNIWGETVHREITTERWKGDYAFEFVEPGSYTIKEESREGWIQTKPTGGEYQVEVNCGDKVIDQDFGNEPAGLYTLRPSPVLLRVGDTGTLTITLTKPAPTGGVTFTLSIDDDDIAGISSTTVTIAEGEEQASLTVTAKKADDTEVTITQATEGWEPKGQGDDKTAVRVGPDLSITPDAIDIPITDIATLKYKIRATVTNAPERVNADPFKVKIEEEDPKTGDVRVLYDMNLPGLAGGSSTTIEVDYLPEIPRALIRVFVDAANVLEEKDEGNNKATKEFVVTLIEDVTALFDGDKDPDIFGRFISHPELADVENTFTADVLDGVEIEKVVFELNDIVIEDGSSGGGWTADYSMGLLPDGTNKMTIFAIGPRDMKSEPITKVVKIEEFPDWIKVSVNIGLLGFGGSVELTPTHLFVAFSFKLGASKGGGPFSYQAQINNVVEFIPKESIDAETKLEFKLGIPLDEDVGWAGGGHLHPHPTGAG